MPLICKRFFVSGTVQGVFYRDSTRRKAEELSLTGWVKNLKDGRVELVACGDPQKINMLEAWLWEGPPAASVDEVISEETTLETYPNFSIK